MPRSISSPSKSPFRSIPLSQKTFVLLVVPLFLLLVVTLHYHRDDLPNPTSLTSFSFSSKPTRPLSSSPHIHDPLHYSLPSLLQFHTLPLAFHSVYPFSYSENARKPSIKGNQSTIFSSYQNLYAHHSVHQCPHQPHLRYLRMVVDAFSTPENLSYPERLVLRPDTLFIVLDLPSNNNISKSILPQSFVESLTSLYHHNSFHRVFLLDLSDSSTSPSSTLTQLLASQNINLRTLASRGSDHNLFLARSAAHLIPYGGANAALASLVARGSVYMFQDIDQDSSFWMLNDEYLKYLVVNPVIITSTGIPQHDSSVKKEQTLAPVDQVNTTESEIETTTTRAAVTDTQAESIISNVTEDITSVTTGPSEERQSTQLESDSSSSQISISKSDFSWQRFMRYIGSVTPSCCRLRAYSSSKDDKSVICDNIHALSPQVASKEGCWVLSAGPHPKYHFEREMIRLTRCEMHIFSCPLTEGKTERKKIPKRILSRVSVYPLCLRSSEINDGATGNETISWIQALELVKRKNKDIIPPAVLRLDDHGYELSLLKELTLMDTKLLPYQLLLSFRLTTTENVGHPYTEAVEKDGQKMWSMTEESMEETFEWLFLVGYRVVYRADIPDCPTCAQVTLVRENYIPE